ncbi:unnamed protein product, partial [Didymodactylos carnosus]
WGHLLGDEAGGYWITQRAIKKVIDDQDNLKVSRYDLTRLRGEIQNFFQITEMSQLLSHFYKDFQKDSIARFSQIIGELASAQSDDASIEILCEAGFMLGLHLRAISSYINKQLYEDGTLKVIANGSVFKSWKFLKPGFIDALLSSKIIPFQKIELVQLTAPAAIGAAIWGARQNQTPLLNIDFSKHFTILDTIDDLEKNSSEASIILMDDSLSDDQLINTTLIQLSDFDLSQIDDKEFDIPQLDSLPSLESILNDQQHTSSSYSSHNTSDVPLINSYIHPSSQLSSSLDSFLTNDYNSALSNISLDSLSNSLIDIPQLDIPQHDQINHGSLIKVKELNTISNQLQLCMERTSYGNPTCIDVISNRLLAIGTTKSCVLLFEHRTQKLKHCLNTPMNLNGAVSALNFNYDCTRLLVGYARGRIHMYDCTNGKILRNISDCHLPDTAVLHVKYTHDPTLALFSDSSGSVYVMQFTRHIKRDYQSKCLFSGSRGEVCCIEPLIFTETTEKLKQHPLKSMYIVALATFTKLFIIALKLHGQVKILRIHR